MEMVVSKRGDGLHTSRSVCVWCMRACIYILSAVVGHAYKLLHHSILLQAALDQLMEMGFTDHRAKKALLLNKYIQCSFCACSVYCMCAYSVYCMCAYTCIV